jgi:hypothetical protein
MDETGFGDRERMRRAFPRTLGHVRQLQGGVRPHRGRLEVRDGQRPGPA